MLRQSLSSSTIVGVGYDANRRVLEIEFRGSGVYQYRGVPPFVHEGLLTATSHGRLFAQRIRGRYSFRRVGS